MILASARQTAGESISTIASAKQTFSGSAQANGLTGGLDRNGETDCPHNRFPLHHYGVVVGPLVAPATKRRIAIQIHAPTKATIILPMRPPAPMPNKLKIHPPITAPMIPTMISPTIP